MSEFTILKHEYENDGGNYMTLFSEVYLYDEDRTIYCATIEDAVELYSVDTRYEEFRDHESIVWYGTDMEISDKDQYAKLVRVLYNEFNKRYGKIKVYCDWLTDELRSKVPNWYIKRAHARGEYAHVFTDGTIVELDEAFGPAPEAQYCLPAEKYSLTVSALRAFSEAYMSLLEVWTDDVNDDLCPRYPFDRSFDELNVNDWVNHALVNLEKRWQEDHND